MCIGNPPQPPATTSNGSTQDCKQVLMDSLATSGETGGGGGFYDCQATNDIARCGLSTGVAFSVTS
jgi:hypothetical protein